MEGKIQTIILSLFFACFLCPNAFCQQKKDEESNIVHLLSAERASIVQENGVTYRKVVGSARFLHNDTYFLCDTAYWNVETNVIDAWGNVSLLQDETVLTSDKLIYQVDSSLAMFRGSLVQLLDKDNTTLRTRFLDYHTDDSVAVFSNGASMRDKDGQIIESVDGMYESKLHLFTFYTDVNMFSDTTFIRSNRLKYYSDKNIAYFDENIDAWHSDSMLASQSGYYDRENEIFFFTDKVHLQSPQREGWSDSLYVYRKSGDLRMLGNAQLTNEENMTHALAGRIDYTDSTSFVDMSREPAILAETEQDGKKDTLYMSAVHLIQYSEIVGDMADSLFREHEKTKIDEANVDPVGEYRIKAAKEAAEAAAKKAAEDPNNAYKNSKAYKEKREAEIADSLARVRRQADSLARIKRVEDSLARIAASADTTSRAENALADSLENALPKKDTLKVNFVRGVGRVKLFRKDLQVVCDSLLYNDYDSLARLFVEPIIWSEINRQFNADSMQIVVKGGHMHRLNMLSNAFVHLQDEKDTSFFNQIRGAEMAAFFDTTAALTRYDAMGDATALFYIEENDVIATANKVESKMLSANFVNGEISRVHYYASPKSDAFPVATMKSEDKRIKGFIWSPSRRPTKPEDVTHRKLRSSERARYNGVQSPQFRYTNIFFPGYMAEINKQIAIRDSLKKLGPQPKDEPVSEAELERADSLASSADSLRLAVKDSLITDLEAEAKAEVKAPSDSLSAPSDSLSAKTAAVDTTAAPAGSAKDEIKAQKAQERADKRAARQSKRDERWAAKEAKAKAKEEAAKQRKLEKERAKKRRALKDQWLREQKENEIRNKYLLKLNKKSSKSK